MPTKSTTPKKKFSLSALTQNTRNVTVKLGQYEPIPVTLTFSPAKLSVRHVRQINELQKRIEAGEEVGHDMLFVMADIFKAIVVDWDLEDEYSPATVEELSPVILEALVSGLFNAVNGNEDELAEGDDSPNS